MEDKPTTVRARYLGRVLDSALRAAGLNASDISALLGWSPSKTSRMLSGKRGASRDDVAAFLALCRVVGKRRRALLDLCGDLYAPMWWQATDSEGSSCLQTVADAESDARAITTYDPAAVPGLVQTADYTRAALSRQWSGSIAEVDHRAASIKARRHIVDNHDWYQRTVTAFVEARSLTSADGGDTDVLSAQWHQLLRLAVGPTIAIRVLPDSPWAHAPAAFTLLEFTDHDPAVCLEQPTCVGFLQGPDTIGRYRNIIAELDRQALDEDTSRQWISDLAAHGGVGWPDSTHEPAAARTGIWVS